MFKIHGEKPRNRTEDEKEKILFDYAFLQGELNSETERTSFAQGFKTGLLLGAEVFSDINKND